MRGEIPLFSIPKEKIMVRRSKSSLIPSAILLILFFGSLIGVHLTVNSEIGRDIADASILVAFLLIVVLWMDKK
jgi:hypothetical protein